MVIYSIYSPLFFFRAVWRDLALKTSFIIPLSDYYLIDQQSIILLCSYVLSDMMLVFGGEIIAEFLWD